MPRHVLRVDAPARVRRYSTGVKDGGLTVLAVLFGLLTLVGVIALTIQIIGTSTGGAIACSLWTAWMVWATGWSIVTRRQVRRWLQPVNLSPHRIDQAHAAYWKLTPETRSAYGLPLIEAIYRRSLIRVEGREAQRRIDVQMLNRVRALERLVDAEDKQRLYAVDPTLSDRDDLDAAELFQRAVSAAQRQLADDAT